MQIIQRCSKFQRVKGIYLILKFSHPKIYNQVKGFIGHKGVSKRNLEGYVAPCFMIH
jgi:hypothetical protein